ncbi:MAG: hypothetical protein HY558_00315 [Euryarchaeota archaeon]|nr:hypothetical protein [Euryarchaeota archaeon]
MLTREIMALAYYVVELEESRETLTSKVIAEAMDKDIHRVSGLMKDLVNKGLFKREILKEFPKKVRYIPTKKGLRYGEYCFHRKDVDKSWLARL